MSEPMFGSVSQPWAAAPFPPMAWPPSSMAAVGGPLAGAAWATLPPPLGVAGGIPSMLSPVPSLAVGNVTPGIGVPVPAFLAMVAVRRGQPLGPTNDQEIEDFIYDALDLLPGSSEIDVRCEGGRVAFTGTVHYKRLKRDVGEIAWAIPNVTDVHNTVTIAARRRSRGVTQGEPQATVGRKSA